jgi:hypothetical protein
MNTGIRYVPLGYQQLSPSAVTKLTVPDGANFAVIVPETQGVRWRDDGTDPDANTGMLLTAGTQLEYSGDLSAIRFIQAAASAKLNVSYYRIAG